ncbi:ABC transporter ATP-binding protein [Arachnia propionica]|uniref:ABC transporter ATP-binding protein n=1 Tax=Arachnia propionica TaxID=1750 RepID=A0A3P1T9J5_9ACTN|nr:ABC transporter ATP-binding protein [Arachnia propionica]RRD05143.1 ABC transporter ATP-binding protein [Arachnia propionica]
MSAVTCRDVHRRFKDVTALDGVSLEIEPRQIFGLLGPNGSGKTTLLNQLQGLDHPTSGTVEVLGLDPVRQRDQLATRMGSQLQESTTIPRLTVAEVLTTFASFYDHTRDIDDLLAELGLTSKAGSRIERLSGGQRQRVFIALALLHDPELLFLDELTSAVDPQARLAIWDVLRGLRDQGRTIVITTHSMAEAAALCDRIAIIDAGRIIAEGTLAELIGRHTNGTVLRLETETPPTPELLQDIDQVTSVTLDGGVLVVTGSGQFTPVVMARLAAAGIEVTAMGLTEPTLEDVFLTLTGRAMREGE